MKYCNAVVWVNKIKEFKENLKGINIEKADAKRDGQYTIALKELELVLNSEMSMEDVFMNPDNILRNIIMLAHLDKIDATTRK